MTLIGVLETRRLLKSCTKSRAPDFTRTRSNGIGKSPLYLSLCATYELLLLTLEPNCFFLVACLDNIFSGSLTVSLFAKSKTALTRFHRRGSRFVHSCCLFVYGVHSDEFATYLLLFICAFLLLFDCGLFTCRP